MLVLAGQGFDSRSGQEYLKGLGSLVLGLELSISPSLLEAALECLSYKLSGALARSRFGSRRGKGSYLEAAKCKKETEPIPIPKPIDNCQVLSFRIFKAAP